jgi:uncharacterized protein YkwD
MRFPRILIALTIALLAAPATAGAQECANTTVVPAAENLGAVRGAILCLTNAQRARHGLQPLRTNPQLQRGAGARVDDMVETGYYAHTSPAGVPFDRPLERAGYGRHATHIDMSENLGQATGDFSSAADLIDGWMASPDHRANLLRPTYRDAGIGIRVDGDDVTFAMEFGATR